MRKDLERKCENYTLCQARSSAGKKRIAPLQTINVGIRFSKVAADILGPVTRAKTSGAKYILVLADYFTKYVACVPLKRTTAKGVARAIVENWVLTFGVVADVISKYCANNPSSWDQMIPYLNFV